MLKLRLVTAVILIPLVLYILFAATPEVFRFATAVLVCLAAWEWPTLMGKTNVLMRMGYVIMSVAFLFITQLLPLTWLLTIATLGWLIQAYWVIHYPEKRIQWAGAWQVGSMGIQVIIPCFVALNYLRELPHAHLLLIILLLLIWGADTSAYFVGRRYGRSKLIPEVSPNKSWQGFYAAIACGFLIAVIAIICLNDVFNGHGLGFLILALLTTLASVLGDLTESMLKRAQGVKDSGNLLPGHGGILDRIDSLTAAAPVYTLGIVLLGIN